MSQKHAENLEARLPVSRAASILGVHAQTLRNYEARGFISSTRTVGGERRFRLGDVLELRDNPPELYKRQRPAAEESAA